jgi:uncharacterized repeat protein (TIGR03803 family)
VIYRFTGGADDGATPVSGLIEVNGTFYGTTLLGGDVRYCDCGTVYSITKSGKEKMMLRAASIGAGHDVWYDDRRRAGPFRSWN